MDTGTYLPSLEFFQPALQRLVVVFFIIFFLCVCILPYTRWQDNFVIFKKPSFYKFLKYFVAFFQSIKQTLHNFATFSAPVVTIFAWSLYKWIILHDFKPLFRNAVKWSDTHWISRRQMLQGFWSVSDHFTTLQSKGLTFLLEPRYTSAIVFVLSLSPLSVEDRLLCQALSFGV